ETVGAQRHQTTRNPRRDLIGHDFHEIGYRNKHALFLFEHGLDVGFLRRFGRVQHIPTFAAERVDAELLVIRRAPDISGDLVAFSQDFLSLQRRANDRSAREDVRFSGTGVPPVRRTRGTHGRDARATKLRPGFETREALENSFLDAVWQRRHGVMLVVECEIMKNVFALLVHPANSVLANDCYLEW